MLVGTMLVGRLGVVLFEISNSMKPHPSVFHACTSEFRPVIGGLEQSRLDEVSDCIPPASHRCEGA